MKKIVATMMGLLSLCTVCLSGCGGTTNTPPGVDPIEQVDKNKSQIYIGNYDGGVGSAWINAVKEKFEAKYAETSFESGKKGVQIITENSKNNDGGTIASLINTSQNEVWFTEQVYYYSLLNSNCLLDITDMVTEKYEQYDRANDGVDGKVATSIEDRMEATNRNYFKTPTSLGDKGDKYYGLPFYEAFYTMFYDIQLFEENNLFMKEGGGYCTKESDVKSKGPDGKAGTYDDGLPATYDEFYALMTRMKLMDITPFVWSGAYITYLAKAMVNFWADYEGFEQMQLNVSLNGTATSLVNVADDGSVTPYDSGETVINNANAYLLQKQEGKYQALKFLREVMNDADNMNTRSFQSSFSHLNAQDAFLYPRYNPSMEQNAILVDGTWWESEATSTFNTLVDGGNEGASKQDRKFGILPIPKATEAKVGEKATLYNMNSSACVVSKTVKPEKYELIKKFIQYVHSNEGLSIFNSVTSMTRPFEYTIENDMWNNMSYYGQSLYEYTKNADIVYPLNSGDAMFLDNETFFNAAYNWSFTSIISGQTVVTSDMPSRFKNYPSMTAAQYFNGMYDYNQKYWSTFNGYLK